MSAPQGDHDARGTEDEEADLLDSLAMKTAEGRLNNRRVHNKVCGAKPPISHVLGKATYFPRLGQSHLFHTLSRVSIQTEGGFAPH